MSLLHVKNISVAIANKIVLKNIDMSVSRGEIVTLIGPNGAGKSTLVRTVLGLLKPVSGSVWLKPGITIGYMPQKLFIEPYLPLSVERFLKLGGRGRIAPSTEKIKNAVTEVGVPHLLREDIQNISGGEFQRVLLARTLLREPDILVLDEPVQGVDLTGQLELYRLIMRVRDKRNCGVLMVSHDLHVVMAGTDSVICLNHHVCCQGRPELVSQHPEFISLFGIRDPETIAVYAHDHNHRHDHSHMHDHNHHHTHAQTHPHTHAHPNAHEHEKGCNHDEK